MKGAWLNASNFATFFGKRKLHKTNKYYLCGISYSKNMANYEAYNLLGHFIKHKPLIPEELLDNNLPK